MAPFRGLSGSAQRPTLSPPGLTPPDVGDIEMQQPESVAQVGPAGGRTTQVPLAPVSENRINLANRSRFGYQPGPSYANTDPQKGGAPGSPGSVITSENPEGVTVEGQAPFSPAKLSYGQSDWGDFPTFIASHLVINRNANPNRPQVNPTPFNNEGPSQNTQYTSPAPWAAGVFIG